MHTKTWLIFLCLNIALISQFKVTNAKPIDEEDGSVTESPIIFPNQEDIEENTNNSETKEAEAQQEAADKVVEKAEDEEVDEDLDEVTDDDEVITEKPDNEIVEAKEEIEELEAQLDRLDQSSTDDIIVEKSTTIASVIPDQSSVEEKSDQMEEVVEEVVVEAVDELVDVAADDEKVVDKVDVEEDIEDVKDIEDIEDIKDIIVGEADEEEVVVEAVNKVSDESVDKVLDEVEDIDVEKSTKVPVNLDRSDYAQPRKVEPENSDAKANNEPSKDEPINEESVKQESPKKTLGLRMEIIIAFAVMGVLLFICFVIITYLMCKNKKSSKKSVDGSGYYPNYNIRIPHLPDPRQAARYSYTNTYPGNYFYTKYPASHPYIPHY